MIENFDNKGKSRVQRGVRTVLEGAKLKGKNKGTKDKGNKQRGKGCSSTKERKVGVERSGLGYGRGCVVCAVKDLLRQLCCCVSKRRNVSTFALNFQKNFAVKNYL